MQGSRPGPKGLRSRSRIWPFLKGLYGTFIILFLTKIVLLYTCISKGMLLKMVLSGGSCSPPAGGSCCPARPPSRGRGRRPRSGTGLGPSAGPAPTSRVGTDYRRDIFSCSDLSVQTPPERPERVDCLAPNAPPHPYSTAVQRFLLPLCLHYSAPPRFKTITRFQPSPTFTKSR